MESFLGGLGDRFPQVIVVKVFKKPRPLGGEFHPRTTISNSCPRANGPESNPHGDGRRSTYSHDQSRTPAEPWAAWLSASPSPSPSPSEAGTQAAHSFGSDHLATVEALVREAWSPEQIHGRLQREHGQTISHEWMYQYIYQDQQAGGDLYRSRRCQKTRRKRYGCYSRRGRIPNQVSIDERLAVVTTRQRLGDWEGDTG